MSRTCLERSEQLTKGISNENALSQDPPSLQLYTHVFALFINWHKQNSPLEGYKCINNDAILNNAALKTYRVLQKNVIIVIMNEQQRQQQRQL